MHEQYTPSETALQVMTDPALPPSARSVYMTLLNLIEDGILHYVGQQDLSTRCGISVRSTQRAMNLLVERGYVSVTRSISGIPNTVEIVGINAVPLLKIDRHLGTSESALTIWDKLRPMILPVILERDGHACLACGSRDDLTIDHIVSRIFGGSNDLANLQTLCHSCNRAKRQRVIDYRRPLASRTNPA